MAIRTTELAPALLLGLVLCLAAPAPAAAQLEVEVDPMAYAASGFSLHVATVLGPTRLNVGVFGADIPSWFHGNDGWRSTMRGAGVKWDHVGATSDGLFVGAEGGYMRMDYQLLAQAETVRRDVVGVGLRAGYRLPVGGRGLYVAPWVGVSYNFDGSDVMIAGESFDRRPVGIFPTVHVGWRF